MRTIKTAEQIAKEADHLNGIDNVARIFQAYRAQDESHLWPINGKYNATNRAISKATVFCRANGPVYGLELCYLIEQFLSDIVNSEL